jgi:hypothetical protein
VNAKTFVAALAAIKLPNVFNPYSDICSIYDIAKASKVRCRNLVTYLRAIEQLESDTIWMGRDLGYRGGRRTGLALTDESHLPALEDCYPGSRPVRATIGPAIAERTATEIWAMIRQLPVPPLLWNVFPFHPHEPEEQLSNRRFTARELDAVDELNRELVEWLGIRRIICIGQDAAKYAETFDVEVECVRHPSYGGVKDFRSGVQNLYAHVMCATSAPQHALF